MSTSREALLRCRCSLRFAGPIVDVGSGGGSPGIPVAVALPDRAVTLLEANGRKAAALERFVRDIPNAEVVRGRAEEQPLETYGVALARALAPPPVAVEWCLPLVATGGAAVLYVGPTADAEATEQAGRQVGGGALEEPPGLFVIPKVALDAGSGFRAVRGWRESARWPDR